MFARRGRSGGFSRPLPIFGGDAFGLDLAGGGVTVALTFSTSRGNGANAQGPGPAWVKRRAGGRPFGAAVDLDGAAAAPAAVAVTGAGDVVAVWNACRGASCLARIAVSVRGGAFQAPVSIGAENFVDAPAVFANGGRVLVTWQLGDAVQGAFVSTRSSVHGAGPATTARATASNVGSAGSARIRASSAPARSSSASAGAARWTSPTKPARARA